MQKLNLVYESKNKKLFKTDDKDLLIVSFEGDEADLQAKFSAYIFSLLNEANIANHMLRQLNEKELLVKKASMIPLKVLVRNVAYASLSLKLGLADGASLPFSLVEFYTKSDELLNDEHCLVMGLVRSENDLNTLRKISREINLIIKAAFEKKGLRLADFAVKFGTDSDGRIMLASEIGASDCTILNSDGSALRAGEILKRMLA